MSNRQFEEFAPAKVNLALHVLGRRSDGFHELSSLVVFAGIRDRLVFEPSETLTLEIDGPYADGVPLNDRNLVMQAAKRFGGRRGAHIRLTKNLPHGAGIGGGSADAAAALRGLANLWGRTSIDPAMALSLGADVPVCLRSPEPTMMRGKGERLSSIPALPKAWLLLVNPGVQLATKDVFAHLGEAGALNFPPVPDIPKDMTLEQFAKWLGRLRNDLTRSASHISPVVGRVLKELSQLDDCLAHKMSGSGSTCWGLFATRDQAEQAAKDLRKVYPKWWFAPARLL